MKRAGGGSQRVNEWWDDVLAGESDKPHPNLGDQIRVRLHNDRLALSGQVDSASELQALVAQARARIGHGVNHVDTSGLHVDRRPEQRGVLEQALVAAYSDRATAELAGKLVQQHAQISPHQQAIVDRTNPQRLDGLLPPDFVDDARARIARGDALLILSVDEIDAFKVRGIVEEETRSTWTVAAPPTRARHG